MKDICYIVYSHSDYSDVWPVYFGQTEKYFSEKQKMAIFLDKKSTLVPKNYTQVVYNDKKSYTERLINCFKQLQKMGFDYCLFSHEDMFLYDKPNFEKLSRYIKAVQKGYFDFIKLIRGGENVFEQSIIDETLFEIDNKSEWIFAVQPSIWNIDKLLQILEFHKKDTIWSLEVNSQNTCRKLKIKGAFSFDEGKKRGIYHYDNSIYPYIATAIVKGKWNTKEYDILEKIISEYGIDKNKRGEFV